MATHFKGPIISAGGFSAPAEVTGSFLVDNLKLDDNTLSSENTNGDINLAPNGTGKVAVTGAGLAVGSGGSTIKAIKSGTVSVTVSALAAAAEEDISLTITGAAAGDIVMIQPPDAAAETGLGKALCWVSAANTVKLRVSNFSGSSLTGSTANWTYIWFDLT